MLPIRPGDRLLIRWHSITPDEIRFTGSIGTSERIALTGTLRMAPR